MINTKPAKAIKKAYVKPKMTGVRLTPQEAVLDVCKNGINTTPLCLNVCSNVVGS